MKKIVLLFALAFLIPGSHILHGQTADCQKKCQDRKTQCSNSCMVMAADNTGCEERCVKENARCLGGCRSAKPYDGSCVNDDSDYEDYDDEDDDDVLDDVEDDFDKDDDFSDMEDDFCD